jgi:hypothetical protein
MILKPKNWYKRYFGGPVKKHKAWHKYLEVQAERHGFQVYKLHLNWLLPGRFQDVVKAWGDTPGLPMDRCHVLFEAATALAEAGVEGDTADCGVRYGKSSFFLLHGLGDASRGHYLFDSFEGLSEPSAEDELSTDLVKDWQRGDLAVSETQVRTFLKSFDNCHYLKGWIPERFEAVTDKRFAMVHVDVDLYEPTRDCYQFFYERLVPGGLIICDDYGSSRCPGATRAIDEFMADKTEAVLQLPTGQALVYKKP